MKKLTLMAAAILLVFATFLTVGCSTTEEVVAFNINGTWNLAVTEGITEIWTITFTGGDTGGTVTDTWPGGGGIGTYTRTVNQITITMTYGGGWLTVTYTGNITSTNHMSGTHTTTIPTNGTWLATR